MYTIHKTNNILHKELIYLTYSWAYELLKVTQRCHTSFDGIVTHQPSIEQSTHTLRIDVRFAHVFGGMCSAMARISCQRKPRRASSRHGRCSKGITALFFEGGGGGISAERAIVGGGIVLDCHVKASDKGSVQLTIYIYNTEE